MASQLDLDQGGHYRESQRLYLGPSVGWVTLQAQWVENVVAAGVATILRGTNMILVNFNGSVTIQLPSFLASAAGPQAIPNQFAIIPVVICDIGGFADLSNPIDILPAAGELISGLAAIDITTPYGSLVIRPDIVNGGGTLMQ